MGVKQMKMIMCISLLFTGIVFIIALSFSEEHASMFAAASVGGVQGNLFSQKVRTPLPEHDISGESYSDGLSLLIPEGVAEGDITIESDYVKRTIKITMKNITDSSVLKKVLPKKSNILLKRSYVFEKETAVFNLLMDRVYEHEFIKKGGRTYLHLMSPWKKYKHVIVIDAGHGGNDSGSAQNGIEERNLNLSVTLKLKKLLDAQTDVKAYYTRTENINPSYEGRISLANDLGADFFVSIHMNSDKSSVPKGTEILYSENKLDTVISSEEVAEIFLNGVVPVLGFELREVIPRNDLYVMRNAKVPAVLVEVGFISNGEDAANLKNEDCQDRAAQGIYNSIIQALKEKESRMKK